MHVKRNETKHNDLQQTTGQKNIADNYATPRLLYELHLRDNYLVIKIKRVYIYITFHILEGWPSWLKAQVC